jgi:hypothetical protein
MSAALLVTLLLSSYLSFSFVLGSALGRLLRERSRGSRREPQLPALSAAARARR